MIRRGGIQCVEIRGGEIRDDEIPGGEIRGGEIRYGEIRGGKIRGGEIHYDEKNEFHCDEIQHDELQCGVMHHFVNDRVQLQDHFDARMEFHRPLSPSIPLSGHQHWEWTPLAHTLIVPYTGRKTRQRWHFHEHLGLSDYSNRHT